MAVEVINQQAKQMTKKSVKDKYREKRRERETKTTGIINQKCCFRHLKAVGKVIEISKNISMSCPSDTEITVDGLMRIFFLVHLSQEIFIWLFFIFFSSWRRGYIL